MIALAHVGDSRPNLIRSQSLMPLTQDHSLVEDLLARGLISRDDALNHPRRNVQIRAVGIAGQVEPDFSTHTLQSGDTLLLCADGLTKMLDESEILDLVVSANGSPEVACRKLVDAANNHGGIDNVTTIVVCQNIGS
jgi:protein phosphatase